MFALLFFAFASAQTNLGSYHPTFSINNAGGGFFSNNQITFVEGGTSVSVVSYPACPSYTISYSFTNKSLTFNTNTFYGSISLSTGISGSGGDICFDNEYNGITGIRGTGNNYVASLGVLSQSDYNNLDPSILMYLPGLQTYNVIPNSTLTAGLVIGVIDNYPQGGGSWNFAKIQIQSYNWPTVYLSWNTYTFTGFPNTQRKTTIGSGFYSLKDIIMSNSGAYYYLSDTGGGAWIYQYPVGSTFTQSSSNYLLPFSDYLEGPQQLLQDPVTNLLYTVDSVRNILFSYSLATQTTTYVNTVLSSPIGVAGFPPTGSYTSIYISQTGGTSGVYVINLANPSTSTLVASISSPGFLRFNPLDSNHLFVCSGSEIIDINLSAGTMSVVSSLSFGGNPSDIIPLTTAGQIVAGEYIIPGSNFLDVAQISSGLINSGGPLILGLGFIPVSNIAQSGPGQGLATVEAPGYPIYLIDSPLGGTLTLLINWQAARAAGYTHYTIYFGNSYQLYPFGDYLWSSATNSFAYTLTSPVDTYYFPLRNYGQLWLNYWWGGLIDSYGTSGLQTLYVRFYIISGSTISLKQTIETYLMIDNQPPTATINQIYYYNNGQNNPVSACSIVTNTTNPPSTLFQFSITAYDPDGHLLDYALSATWGLNQGSAVASGTYYPNNVPSPDTGIWYGISNTLTPYWNANVPGDPTSVKCAHSFWLSCWDRATNGFSYIH